MNDEIDDVRLVLLRQKILNARVNGASFDEIARDNNLTMATTKEHYLAAIGDVGDSTKALAMHDLELRMLRLDLWVSEASKLFASDDAKTIIDTVRALADLEAKRTQIILGKAKHEEIDRASKIESNSKEAFMITLLRRQERPDVD